MRLIVPSAAVLRQKYALVSALRAQGFAIGSCEDGKPGPNDLYLVAEGEVPPAASRTLILGSGRCEAVPFRDGNPARLCYDSEDAAIGVGFASALARGARAPVAADPESLALLALSERVAASDISVLINGPTGTGKEVLAQAIHQGSARRDGPFVAINCAALPETMLEAMLFGHHKGAFTGASSGGQGFFRAANGGTLLLDEIAEMPLNLQAKLLRALQEREVVPIGATTPEKIDVRVIACANRDLHAEVQAGQFRADLYYRLSVFPLATKPLAERPGDVAALAAAMVLRHAGDRPVLPWISNEAVEVLIDHDWPGNVRELENVIQRALLLAPGNRILPEHLTFDRVAPARGEGPATLSNIVQMHEFHAIRETLAECNGSRIETARRLGISERTLRYRLAKAREQGEDIDPEGLGMSSIGEIGGSTGGAISIDRVMALRAQILERNSALARANEDFPATGAAESGGTSFAATLENALKDVNQSQNAANDLSASYERGDTIDIAKVMLARQQASVGFEATLQVRNKLLSAYKDIMSMPV